MRATRMITNRLLTILAASVLALALWAAPAQALLLGFYNISGNSATNAAIGEAQLFVNVTDPLGNENLSATQALFTFGNLLLGNSCVISEVYFDDGSLLGIASIINSPPGVVFSQFATPAELPAANNATPPFETTVGFSADANNPAPQKGVGPGESLGILFNLQSGQTLEDVFSELGTGELRVGMHVVAFASGGSESFVSKPPENPVPEPTTMLLLGAGLLGLGARRIWAK